MSETTPAKTQTLQPRDSFIASLSGRHGQPLQGELKQLAEEIVDLRDAQHTAAPMVSKAKRNDVVRKLAGCGFIVSTEHIVDSVAGWVGLEWPNEDTMGQTKPKHEPMPLRDAQGRSMAEAIPSGAMIESVELNRRTKDTGDEAELDRVGEIVWNSMCHGSKAPPWKYANAVAKMECHCIAEAVLAEVRKPVDIEEAAKCLHESWTESVGGIAFWEQTDPQVQAYYRNQARAILALARVPIAEPKDDLIERLRNARQFVVSKAEYDHAVAIRDAIALLEKSKA